MVRHHPYKCDSKAYENYFNAQAGRGLPVFIGGQRGRGLGSILGGIGRSLVPLLKSGGRALLKQGARSGLRVVNDVLSGRDLKSSLRHRGKQAGKRLLDRAINSGVLVGGVTKPTPPGEPFRKRIKPTTSSRLSQITKRRKKKKKSASPRDIFG